MNKKVLIPIPAADFDPTESAVPWKILKDSHVEVVFATPTGFIAACDQRMLNGNGLGPLAGVLAADKNAKVAYFEMSLSREFKNPIAWKNINPSDYDGIILPGGHAQGMKEYLESKVLQKVVSKFFELNKPVGAICHGVVLAARSRATNGKSVLYGKKTTALLASQELLAWGMTVAWLKNYYRTYKQTVESEVKSNLNSSKDFIKGPIPISRDSLENLKAGFTVQDGKYLSARWPGDAYSFGLEFSKLLKK